MAREVDEHGTGAVEGGEVDRSGAAAPAAAQRLVRGEKRIGRLGSPQEPGGLLEAGVLGEAGIWLSELTPLRPDLETVFLELTRSEQLGGAK